MNKFDNRIKYVLDSYVDFIVKLFNSNPLNCCFGVFLLFVGFCVIPTIFVLIYIFKEIYDYINISFKFIFFIEKFTRVNKKNDLYY